MRFVDLVGEYEGQTAIVVGGGPSALEYVTEWPDDAIVISANEHALKLPGGRCDFVVANDPIKNKIETAALEAGWLPDGGPYPQIICPYGWADYQLGEFYQANNSGVLAAWCAHMMGCYPVVITGMDLYQGGTYFHDEEVDNPGRRWNLDFQVMKWRELAEVRKDCFGIEIRTLLAAGNPLRDVFLDFDPSERVRRSPLYTAPRIANLMGVRVRFTRNCKVRALAYDAGEVGYLTARDARAVVEHYGKAVYEPAEGEAA